MHERRLLVGAMVMALAAVALTLGAADGPRGPESGSIITGQDIGVRILAMRDGRIMGTVVVRVQGRWVDVEGPPPPAEPDVVPAGGAGH